MKILIVSTAAVVFLFASSSRAMADAKLYISISLGGGAVIGMVGYFIHVSLSTRVAEKRQERQPVLAGKRPLDLKTASTFKSFSFPVGPSFKDTEKAPSRPVEIYFVTYRW